MPAHRKPDRQRLLASQLISDALTDFMLSREAMNCTKDTVEFYRNRLLPFLLWAEGELASSPRDITPRLVRKYLAELREQGKSDRTQHAAARAIKTLTKFWHKEGYIDSPVVFEMPKLAKKRLPILTEEQLKTILRACNVRDRAIVMLMADSGLRASEVIGLNWGDINMQTGLITVRQGKGQKDRASVIGANTRRAILAYKRTVDHSPNMPLFQSRVKATANGRFHRIGLLSVYRRLSEITGIHVTPHAMRRTFVILALRADMDSGHIQAMLGHTTLDMVYYYAQMMDEDLVREHHAHSPIDSIR